MTPDASHVIRALGLPNDRTLERHELERLASGLAGRPELWRLGQYTVDPEGALHRISVSYADELRPLEQLAA